MRLEFHIITTLHPSIHWEIGHGSISNEEYLIENLPLKPPVLSLVMVMGNLIWPEFQKYNLHEDFALTFATPALYVKAHFILVLIRIIKEKFD